MFLAGYDDLKLSYDSIILTDEQLPLGFPRLLAVDQPLILPVDTHVRLLITSNDVIHS
jgi:heme/copper-type cytochrome/quinol oxidase subunit 2